MATPHTLLWTMFLKLLLWLQDAASFLTAWILWSNGSSILCHNDIWWYLFWRMRMLEMPSNFHFATSALVPSHYGSDPKKCRDVVTVVWWPSGGDGWSFFYRVWERQSLADHRDGGWRWSLPDSAKRRYLDCSFRWDGWTECIFFQCFKRWKIRICMLKNDRLVVSVQLLHHISVSSDLFQGFYNRLKPLL